MPLRKFSNKMRVNHHHIIIHSITNTIFKASLRLRICILYPGFQTLTAKTQYFLKAIFYSAEKVL